MRPEFELVVYCGYTIVLSTLKRANGFLPRFDNQPTTPVLDLVRQVLTL